MRGCVPVGRSKRAVEGWAKGAGPQCSAQGASAVQAELEGRVTAAEALEGSSIEVLAAQASRASAQAASCGIRIHDLPLTERVLYQLS